MSRATTTLRRACGKLEAVLDDSGCLAEDCSLAADELAQEDYDCEVDEHGGDERAAKRDLAKLYKGDLKRVQARLKRLIATAQAVSDALPAAAEEQLARLEEMEYSGDIELEVDLYDDGDDSF